MCEWSLGLELLQKQSDKVWVLLCWALAILA